jgi:Fe-S oxidoreductase
MTGTIDHSKDGAQGIPASEVKTRIEQLIVSKYLNRCFECGKCSAICPMKDFYGGYVYERSPRGLVERLLFEPEEIYDESLWYCLTCQKCTALCPCGIDFQGFMTELRELLLQRGYNEYALFCPICDSYIMPKKEFEYLQKGPDGEKVGELLSVCERCKKNSYVDTLYKLASWPKR